MKSKAKPGWMQAVPEIKVGKTVISPLKSTLSQSEKDFLAGQKYKEAIVKKTGVYPNTAQ
jgi:hypothetical protein